MMGNVCRHFNQRELIMGGIGTRKSPETGCALGHGLRKIIEAKTAEPMIHVLPRLCCKGGGTEILNCPSYDAKTDAEIEKSRLEMQAAMNRVISAMPAMSAIKADMVMKAEPHRVADCPFCGAVGSMQVEVAVGYNNHMRCKCEECGKGFNE